MNQSFDVPAGERILDVAIANDVPLMHACGGFCACTTCHVLVKSGMDQLAPPEEEELDRMETLDGRTDVSRLGCQSKILGDVVVEIVNLDE